MTFITTPYSFFFRQDQMRYRNILLNFCMTFYASDISKMQSLVRKPVMLLNKIYLSFVRQKLKTTEVRVTVKTDSIVISNCLLKIGSCS